ncbi:MAG: hypothetical protein EXX96DRAFT_596077 [Benjaminiella poitrasii]|nr:MAG: hypothetical protein EXX96DRAFT_596077 [Benjaminiella poitrasii]
MIVWIYQTILMEVFYSTCPLKKLRPFFFNNNEIVYCSEQDFIIKVWGPILSEIFKQAKLTLRWGDITMENTTAPFKVDLRVICTINGDRYDAGFAEFAKNFTAPKAQKDRVKLILEGKEALNTVFKVIGKCVPDIEFYTLQIAGLKGHLISTTLQSNGLYTAQNIDNRIRFLLTNNDIFDQTSHLMKAIIKFKVVTRNIYVGFKSKLIKRSIVGTMFEDK